MEKNKSIEQFFRENLNDKMAYVSSGGLIVEGTIEQKCKLQFIEYFGIICFARLEYNRENIAEKVNSILVDIREVVQINYNQRDQILESLLPVIKDSYVQVGRIISYNVKKMSSLYNQDSVLISVDIEYFDGSTIKLSSIEPFKNK